MPYVGTALNLGLFRVWAWTVKDGDEYSLSIKLTVTISRRQKLNETQDMDEEAFPHSKLYLMEQVHRQKRIHVEVRKAPHKCILGKRISLSI